jgi:hypothetical protein
MNASQTLTENDVKIQNGYQLFMIGLVITSIVQQPLFFIEPELLTHRPIETNNRFKVVK